MSALLEEPHTRGDLRMIGAAIKKGFDIPDAVLETLSKVMANIVVSGSTREKISAARVLVAMQNSNQPQIQQHLHAHADSYTTAQPLQAADGPITIDERKRRCQERIDRLDKLGRI